MELYSQTSYELSKILTERYSTSFGISSSLLDRSIKKHIYAIYGLVRIADEIVDTYKGNDAAAQLQSLKDELYEALAHNYSSNPIVYAFSQTANQYDIDAVLIDPFFASMQTDLTAKTFTQTEYETYIHGSAEVVGLMCLKIFTNGDQDLYDTLRPGATALGSAYQKVNFLRDIRADHEELGRWYFPQGSFDTFNDSAKEAIIIDIQADLSTAGAAITHLPKSARPGVALSYLYYAELLHKLKQATAKQLQVERIRVSALKKLWLYIRVRIGAYA